MWRLLGWKLLSFVDGTEKQKKKTRIVCDSAPTGLKLHPARLSLNLIAGHQRRSHLQIYFGQITALPWSDTGTSEGPVPQKFHRLKLQNDIIYEK